VYGDAVLVGDVTTVQFHSGGSVPPYDRAAYESALEGL
jgi:hypothetical protein